MIKKDFIPNKSIATNKNNAQHNEVQTRIKVALRTNALHLNQLNINVVLPEVFKMTNLTRLDLSYNNIVKLSPKIGELVNLQQLWLNDNPLREIPVEISQCQKLREVDLKNTFIISLPRELANLASLLYVNLDNCPLKESLTNTYQSGMVTIHSELRRKEDRKLYKEKVFDTLTEWIYPSQPKEEVFDKLELLFESLKDCNTEMLKKLHRNCQMLFPVKFQDIDPQIIREKLFKLYKEGIAREDIAKIQLRLKGHFLDEPLEVVVKLATDIFQNVQDQNTVDEFFRYKSHIFNTSLSELTALRLLQNLKAYKAFKRQERIETIEYLKNQIDNLYADEKIKEEKLREYTDGLVKHLLRTSLILEFSKRLKAFMPKYNELKHFNAENISQAFLQELQSQNGQNPAKTMGVNLSPQPYFKHSRSLISQTKRFYERMSTEEYLVNTRRSMTNSELQKTRLNPILEANHMSDCNLRLYGVPQIPIERRFDFLLDECAKHEPDIIFIQMDPMHYLTRQRFASHKCALYEVEDYDKKAIDNFNFPYPMTWEEAVVNLVVFDMLRANQIHMKLDYTKGLSTYAYPDLQDVRTHDNLKDKFVEAITDYVVCDNWSPYYEINQILYKGLMGKHKVVLGDMPEVLLRQIIGNSLSLEDVKDIFKFTLEQISKAKVPLTMQTATITYFSHIFLMPKDLYMTSMLRNICQAAHSCLAFVGTPHFSPIQFYWKPPPYGINYTQATKIPKRLENETDEMLIEKQAILDVLLDTRVWGEKYITNPFPYIEQDLTKIKEADLKHYKKHFYINLKKYQAFRDKVVHPDAYLRIEEVERSIERLGDIKMLPRI